MSEIETDVNNPSLGLLVGIAKTLGTTTDYLLLVNDDPFPPQSTENQIVIEDKSFDGSLSQLKNYIVINEINY